MKKRKKKSMLDVPKSQSVGKFQFTNLPLVQLSILLPVKQTNKQTNTRTRPAQARIAFAFAFAFVLVTGTGTGTGPGVLAR